MKLIEKLKRLLNHKVLLCDLDGTLIETKSGEPFPQDYDYWQFKKHIKEAIQEYNPKYIFIISNQGGIEAGYVDDMKFRSKLNAIMDEIRTWGNYIVDGVYCRSNNPNNLWRKLNVGMIDFFRYDYADGYDFCNRQALMIGDASGLVGQFSDSDLHCAKLAGIKYADVDHFIEAMVPCLAVCIDNELPCCAGEDNPFLPCCGTSRARLKSKLLYNPFVLRMRQHRHKNKR